MNGLSADQIDRELGRWLLQESEMRAPAGLVEDVFARTSRTPQVRRWWPPRPGLLEELGRRVTPSQRPRPQVIGRRRIPAWQRASTLAGALALVAIAVALGIGVSRTGPGPGSPTSPSLSPAASVSPSESPSASPAPVVTPSPKATVLGTFPAQRLSLGVDAGPIDVTEAFGSIWVADIHANDVRRYDPATFAQLARVPVPGAAWFAQADDALWVTNQTGIGLSRIDPATNTVVAHVGDDPPCGAPVVAFGDLWQAACDGDVFLRIDPVRNAVLSTVPAHGHVFLVLADDRLVTVGPEGLARLDPGTGAITAIGAREAAAGAEFATSDGTTVWVKNSAGIARLDPADGRALASFPYPDSKVVSFSGDHAWLTVSNEGVLEIDLATNKVRRTIPLRGTSLAPLEAAGALWVTDFENSSLWRVALP